MFPALPVRCPQPGKNSGTVKTVVVAKGLLITNANSPYRQQTDRCCLNHAESRKWVLRKITLLNSAEINKIGSSRVHEKIAAGPFFIRPGGRAPARRGESF
jgi:hypothetical protein